MSRNGDEIARSGFSDRQSPSESLPIRDRVALFDRLMDVREGDVGASTPISAEPEGWAAFPALAVYPTMEAKVFGIRLGTERSRKCHSLALGQLLAKGMGRTKVTFVPLLTTSRSYYVEMTWSQPEEGRYSDLRHECKPEQGSRIVVTISEENTKWTGLKLAGTVQVDVMRTGAELSAVLFQRAGQDIPVDITLLAVVEMPDGGTPCDRQNAAIYEMANGMQRDKGVDIPHLVLGGSPTIDAGAAGSLASSIAHSERAKSAFESTIALWGLQGNQLHAALDSYSSRSGLTVIHGPPGCGKTHNIMAIAHGHVVAGKAATPEWKGGSVAHLKRRIMVCADSHSAVDHAMNTLLKNAGPDHGLQICCFRGSKTIRPKDGQQQDSALFKDAVKRDEQAKAGVASDLQVDDAELTSANDALFEYVDEVASSEGTFGHAVHPELEYNTQRWKFIIGHVRDKNSPLRDVGHVLMKLRKALRERKGDDAEMRAKIRNAIKAHEDGWTERYWDQVDVVFVTNSSSVHPVLLQYARPNVLISEDLAHATLVDGVTPAAGHINTIQHWLAAGEYRQQALSGLSNTANETVSLVQTPIFATWIENGGLEGLFLLDSQRRMRPIHSGFVSRIWYNRELEDDTSVLAKPDIQHTLEEAHAGLGQHWSGRCRLGVDVSGPGISSAYEGGTHVIQNVAEAEILVAYIKYLLGFEHDGTGKGRRILASDFLVITPYSGQAATIRHLLWIAQIKDINVMTSSTCHGHEANIVLLSLVRNIPGRALDMGFIRARQQLCLSFSRVKVHMVVFGNLLALVQGVRNGWRDFQKGNRGETLGLIMKDFDEKGDLLSGAHLQALMAGQQLKPDDRIY